MLKICLDEMNVKTIRTLTPVKVVEDTTHLQAQSQQSPKQQQQTLDVAARTAQGPVGKIVARSPFRPRPASPMIHPSTASIVVHNLNATSQIKRILDVKKVSQREAGGDQALLRRQRH